MKRSLGRERLARVLPRALGATLAMPAMVTADAQEIELRRRRHLITGEYGGQA
jgi:hypothetical protein